jgi:predicted SnoaL-like aldol condensation-catalyzing enzyme
MDTSLNIIKNAATGFLQLVVSNKIKEAYGIFAANNFRHHNPYFRGDKESLMKAMEENAIENPDKILDIRHIVAEDNMVAVHSHIKQTPDDKGMAVVHLFRFQGDRISEFWDIAMQVPEKMINENEMF